MKKKIWILTMFENYFDSFTEYGVLASALRNERGQGIEFEFNTVSIPSFSKKGFKGVDDSPFGGGVGMIMRPDALEDALLKGVVEPGGYNNIKDELHIVCPAPRGKVWSQTEAQGFAQKNLSLDSTKDIVFVCGRYEGIDERFLDQYIDEFISLGDYILTGGELAVMIILDSAMRFSPGVLGNKLSAVDESFCGNLLEYPLYTRPASFNDVDVPEALKSGDHKRIAKFKEESAIKMTKKYRNDLYVKFEAERGKGES